MLKEYAVYYSLKDSADNTRVKGLIVKTLEEVRKTKRRVKEVGYGFVGVKWRERDKFRYLDEGWQEF